MTERERYILEDLAGFWPSRWVRPMDVGGCNGSHHGATLARLHRRALVDREFRGGYARKMWRYRINAAGRAALSDD